MTAPEGRGDTPAGSASAAISPIPTLPVFFKLKGRRVVIAGGSPPAVWKAELLAAAGAEVTVFASAPCEEMTGLHRRLDGVLDLQAREWSAADLDGAALAIGALEGEQAERFRQAAREAGVPVNVIDVPDLCDFQFGTLVARPPLLIAISTDGAAPVFGQSLRARIEALLPSTITAWARAAKEWRPDLQSLSLGFAARRRFWETFADLALAGTGLGPTDADRQSCLAAALGEKPAARGSLDLVGLGPGDPDLVTLRAIRALQSADLIVHPDGLHPALLSLGRREAQRIRERSTDTATAHMIETFVAQGKGVVWAAPGDPETCRCWLDRRLASSVEPRAKVNGLPCRSCPRASLDTYGDQ